MKTFFGRIITFKALVAQFFFQIAVDDLFIDFFEDQPFRLTNFLNTGCSKSLGHILTLNMSKTIKEITMHLIYSESLQSQVFYRMFKDV